MPDLNPPLSSAVKRQMERQARKDTKPELELRRRLFAAGLRYRVNVPAPGLHRRSIDIAFPRAKVAIFVDGCFWHGCSEHGVSPKNNAAWWSAKIRGNQARDAETVRHMEALGWDAMRVWEHEDPGLVTRRVLDAVKGPKL